MKVRCVSYAAHHEKKLPAALSRAAGLALLRAYFFVVPPQTWARLAGSAGSHGRERLRGITLHLERPVFPSVEPVGVLGRIAAGARCERVRGIGISRAAVVVRHCVPVSRILSERFCTLTL